MFSITRIWYHDHQPEPSEDRTFGEAVWGRCMANITPQQFMDQWRARAGRQVSVQRAVELTIREHYHGPNTDLEARLILLGLCVHLIATRLRGEWS